jgi:hypothetical protein
LFCFCALNIFTKVLGAEKHRRFRNMLGVMELELSLRGSVEMSSSTRADTHDVPQWPFYILARSVTVLHFGTLSDRSTFTSTDARATDFRHGFFGGSCCRLGGFVTSSVCVLAAAGDVLTQQ